MSDHSPCIKLNQSNWTVDGAGEPINCDERDEHPDDEEVLDEDFLDEKEYPIPDTTQVLRGMIEHGIGVLRGIFPEVGDAKLDVDRLISSFGSGAGVGSSRDDWEFAVGVLYGAVKKMFPTFNCDDEFSYARIFIKSHVFAEKIEKLAGEGDDVGLAELGTTHATELFELYKALHLSREAKKEKKRKAHEEYLKRHEEIYKKGDEEIAARKEEQKEEYRQLVKETVEEVLRQQLASMKTSPVTDLY